ncbi:PepSY domain-containing protein [Streptomyces sp. NBC_01520]|uniref:PepSY domain-containing protein n=1 Tax=Streptomyces sp. NBC_01520 TaxID=2903892 RepID=UPI0038651204
MLLSGVPGVGTGHTLAVFVDPYTGEARGDLEQYGSTGALPLRTWIDELHHDLHLGRPGRLYSELAASRLRVVAAGGLVLWFGRRNARAAPADGPPAHTFVARHGTVGSGRRSGCSCCRRRV